MRMFKYRKLFARFARAVIVLLSLAAMGAYFLDIELFAYYLRYAFPIIVLYSLIRLFTTEPNFYFSIAYIALLADYVAFAENTRSGINLILTSAHSFLLIIVMVVYYERPAWHQKATDSDNSQ